MIVGICKILYHFPYTGSIKEKRQRLNSMKSVLRNKFNISISEVDFHNFWQKSMLGIVTVNSDKQMVDKIFSKVVQEIDKLGYGYINDYQVEFINIGEIHK